MIKKDNVEIEFIKKIAGLIKEKFNPKKVILFGSYAYGQPDKKSDIDFLIIMNTDLKFYKQASLIRLALDEVFGVFYPIDIIVRTPEFVEKRIKEGDIFTKSITEKGIEL